MEKYFHEEEYHSNQTGWGTKKKLHGRKENVLPPGEKVLLVCYRCLVILRVRNFLMNIHEHAVIPAEVRETGRRRIIAQLEEADLHLVQILHLQSMPFVHDQVRLSIPLYCYTS